MEGKYQNKINELPSLETFRYENIFKVYNTGDKDFFYYNILKKVSLPDDIDGGLLDTIIMNNQTPLTTLSFQLYGTMHLWWLICVLNNIKNPVSELPIGKEIRYVKKTFLKEVINSIMDQLQ
jgi:hypothetical protein